MLGFTSNHPLYATHVTEELIVSWKIMAAIIIFSAGVIMFGQYINQLIGSTQSFGKPPLYDVLHTYLWDWDGAWNPLIWLWVVIPAVRFTTLKQQHQIQSYILLSLLALILRAITIMFTSQPTCMATCADNPGSWPFNTCFDYVFSGHQVSLTIASLCIIHHKPSIKLIEKIFWVLYIIWCGLWIITTHQHYTVDVILAIIIAYLLCHLPKTKMI